MKLNDGKHSPLPRLLAAALFLAAPRLDASDAELKVGDVFPDLSGFALEGELPAGLKGKIVVVDFWASWCGPCRRTFPLMEELHHRFSKQGLLILAINEDKSRPAMEEFLRLYPVTFSVVRDAKKKLAAAVNVPSLPTSYVVNRDGKVHSIQTGEQIIQNRKAFIKEVERLLLQNGSRTP